jgi:hypothetical protein
MNLDQVRIDSAAIEAGEWIDNIPGAGKLRLKVRGMTNSDYQRKQQNAYSSITADDREEDGKRVKPKVLRRIHAECLVETVLLDWDGLRNNKGEVKYDKKLALQLLTDPDYEAFADAVTWAAAQVGQQRKQAADAIVKN